MGTKNEVARRMRGFFRSDKGNVAMLFALACLAIFPLVGFAVDLSRVMVEKHKLQMATDAAALAAAHDAFMDAEDRLLVVEAHLNHLEEDIGREIEYDFSQDEEGRISLTTRIQVNTTIAQIMGRETVGVTVRSDAVEGGADIEVAMILDVTGSMGGSRISALKTAATDLVDIVVKDEQEPYYSKVSMIPYSVAVNVGGYAEALRGPITTGKNISGASWQVGAQKTITGVTKANPAVVTSNAHGFSNGDTVWIHNVSGMTQLNAKAYTISNVAANTFRLQGVNSSSYSNYSSGGIIRKCASPNCEVTVTANGHGLADGDHVRITGVNGMTQINRTSSRETWEVSNVTANTYRLVGSVGPNYGAYTNSGVSYCTKAGCEFFRFTNRSGAIRVNPISTCATERTGAQAYTDAAPATAYVGRGYMSTSNTCPTNAIIPLTDDKDLLHDEIDSLAVVGSTAGHLGAAWGFYSLSPNFGSIFPADSRPAAFGRPKLYKFAVFMTDGEFNSSFCQGVLSRSSYNMGERINCESENGDSFAQAAQYCTAMKNAGIKVYTVGFETSSSGGVRDALRACATSPQYAYFATGAAQLQDVFQTIGRDINEVRLVK